MSSLTANDPWRKKQLSLPKQENDSAGQFWCATSGAAKLLPGRKSTLPTSHQNTLQTCRPSSKHPQLRTQSRKTEFLNSICALQIQIPGAGKYTKISDLGDQPTLFLSRETLSYTTLLFSSEGILPHCPFKGTSTIGIYHGEILLSHASLIISIFPQLALLQLHDEKPLTVQPYISSLGTTDNTPLSGAPRTLASHVPFLHRPTMLLYHSPYCNSIRPTSYCHSCTTVITQCPGYLSILHTTGTHLTLAIPIRLSETLTTPPN